MKFHNPYHFVPFATPTGGVSTDGDLPPQVTHDRYLQGAHSGRIVCEVETKTPIFIGAKRGEGSPAPVENYTLNGELAIPASSLRGVISSVAEAASNSAFRVLNGDAQYSVRKSIKPGNTLSAIGMVIGSYNSWQLRPLCIPTLQVDVSGVATLPKEFHGLFPKPNLKVYIGDFNSIRDVEFRYRTMNPLDAATNWYALPLKDRNWLPGRQLNFDEWQHRKPSKAGDFILGQVSLDRGREPELLEVVNSQVAVADQDDYVLGTTRVLGCWGNRKDDMPPGKKHELFIPWPADPWPVVPLPQAVVTDFEDICRARTEASRKGNCKDPKKRPLLPFEPIGSRPGRHVTSATDQEQEVQLRHGDLVYFGVDNNGAINEISFSAIWRKWVRNGTDRATASAFFPKELLPYTKKREILSPAEMLFGYVESVVEEQEPTEDKAAKTLASRVSFTAGTPVGKPTVLDSVVLKVLDSPKSPCPAFYFRKRQSRTGGFIAKMELNAAVHEAQGRKFYLHQLDGSPWKSKSEEVTDQQSEVSLVQGTFVFEVHFDNLSDEELGLLLYAMAPAEGFLHKIGMGKGIGLGSVKMTPRLFMVERNTRYKPEGLLQKREGEATDITPVRDSYRKTMNPIIRQAIETLGDPRNLKYPVKHPLLSDQEDEEKETFQWFVANETGKVDMKRDREIPAQRQFLIPLGISKEMPELDQPNWRPRARR